MVYQDYKDTRRTAVSAFSQSEIAEVLRRACTQMHGELTILAIRLDTYNGKLQATVETLYEEFEQYMQDSDKSIAVGTYGSSDIFTANFPFCRLQARRDRPKVRIEVKDLPLAQ